MSPARTQPQTPLLCREMNRRAVAHSGLGAGMIAALLATSAPRVAQAQATPVSSTQGSRPTPVRYSLTGDRIGIEFTPTGGSDPVQLSYEDETGLKTFAGDEVDVSTHPALGQLASVLLDAAPDAFVDYLTVLLPEVHRVEGRTDVPIETLAVVVRHMTSIGGPGLVSGPLQTYAVHPLSGVAVIGPE